MGRFSRYPAVDRSIPASRRVQVGRIDRSAQFVEVVEDPMSYAAMARAEMDRERVAAELAEILGVDHPVHAPRPAEAPPLREEPVDDLVPGGDSSETIHIPVVD